MSACACRAFEFFFLKTQKKIDLFFLVLPTERKLEMKCQPRKPGGLIQSPRNRPIFLSFPRPGRRLQGRRRRRAERRGEERGRENLPIPARRGWGRRCCRRCGGSRRWTPPSATRSTRSSSSASAAPTTPPASTSTTS